MQLPSSRAKHEQKRVWKRLMQQMQADSADSLIATLETAHGVVGHLLRAV